MNNLFSYLALGIIPLVVIFMLFQLKSSQKVFCSLFATQFLIIVANLITTVKTGLLTLATTLLFVVLLTIRASSEKAEWKSSNNPMMWLWLVLGAFLFLEILNPNNVQEAWNITIVHYWVIPMVCAIFVPLCIRSPRAVETLLLIWSGFILLGALNAMFQKFVGFSDMDRYQLFALGKARTHLIWSGIRYFSFFSDAANFGIHMAMAIPVFGISYFYVKKKWMKIYFIVVVAAAIYGMGLSGTRAAIAIPLGALLMLTVLSANIKTISITLGTLALIASFFMFTNIGQGNEYIRKMRSAFRPQQDVSYQVRVENRKQMKILMARKPIGYGLGLAKGAERFDARETMPYPPDSWLVAVWVETGIVGLSLYIGVHLLLFAWCTWILLFRIKNKYFRGLLSAWLCANAGFFIAAYANDVMNYPNPMVVYVGFALTLAGLYFEDESSEAAKEEKKPEKPPLFAI